MLKAVKKTLGWSTIFHELRKVLWKRRSLRIILRFLNEELQSNRVQDSIHELIIWKVNPFNFSGGSRGTVAHNCHGKTKNLTVKTKTSRQNRKPHGKNKAILFLLWSFWFGREVFCFCRAVFGFAVRYFVFAVRFLVLPWCFCFCREAFGFAVPVVGHHTGEVPGPSSLLDQTEPRRVEKNFFWWPPPRLSKGLDGRPPPHPPPPLISRSASGTEFVASVTCSQYQIAFKWSVNFWPQLLSIRWDGKYFNGWNFYLDILQIQENWAGRNLITNSRVYIHKQKCRLKSTTTNGWRHFGQSEQRKSSVLFPIQSEKSPDSGFFACDL